MKLNEMRKKNPLLKVYQWEKLENNPLWEIGDLPHTSLWEIGEDFEDLEDYHTHHPIKSTQNKGTIK